MVTRKAFMKLAGGVPVLMALPLFAGKKKPTIGNYFGKFEVWEKDPYYAIVPDQQPLVFKYKQWRNSDKCRRRIWESVKDKDPYVFKITAPHT